MRLHLFVSWKWISMIRLRISRKWRWESLRCESAFESAYYCYTSSRNYSLSRLSVNCIKSHMCSSHHLTLIISFPVNNPTAIQTLLLNNLNSYKMFTVYMSLFMLLRHKVAHSLLKWRLSFSTSLLIYCSKQRINASSQIPHSLATISLTIIDPLKCLVYNVLLTMFIFHMWPWKNTSHYHLSVKKKAREVNGGPWYKHRTHLQPPLCAQSSENATQPTFVRSIRSCHSPGG